MFGSNVSPFDLGWRKSNFSVLTSHPCTPACIHLTCTHTPNLSGCIALLCAGKWQSSVPTPPAWEITVPKYTHTHTRLHHHTTQKLTHLLGQRSSVITANLALLQPSRVFHLRGGGGMSHHCCSHTHTTQVSVPQQPGFIFYFGVIPSKLHRKKDVQAPWEAEEHNVIIFRSRQSSRCHGDEDGRWQEHRLGVKWSAPVWWEVNKHKSERCLIHPPVYLNTLNCFSPRRDASSCRSFYDGENSYERAALPHKPTSLYLQNKDKYIGLSSFILLPQGDSIFHVKISICLGCCFLNYS